MIRLTFEVVWPLGKTAVLATDEEIEREGWEGLHFKNNQEFRSTLIASQSSDTLSRSRCTFSS